MRSALIGHTGFVGSNLLRQTTFEAHYNSRNIEAIQGERFDAIVCCGAPAVKWLANKEPEQDRENIARLIASLNQVHAKHFILISTVDVYPHPVEVDEDDSIDASKCAPYGKHRLWLEEVVRDRFTSTVIRLPGLFGPGLKKNVIYDLAHNNALELVCADSVFQFYYLDHLWNHIQIVGTHEIPLINFATEGLSVRTIAHEAFGQQFENPRATQPARYDFRTKYDQVFGGTGGYIQDRNQVMSDLTSFVRQLKGQTTP